MRRALATWGVAAWLGIMGTAAGTAAWASTPERGPGVRVGGRVEPAGWNRPRPCPRPYPYPYPYPSRLCPRPYPYPDPYPGPCAY